MSLFKVGIINNSFKNDFMVEIIKTQLLDGDVYGRRILTMQTRSVTLSIFPKNNNRR